MRMVHYFTALAIVVAPALLITMITGVWLRGGTTHLAIGLFSALLAVGAQTLLILFMIITGRVLRAAMDSRPLPAEFLLELNDFFSKKRAYPLAGMAALIVTAAAVLGYGNRAFGSPPAVHMLVGLFAVLFNLWTLQEGWLALRANQDLIDRTERELDRIDREAPETIRPEEPELDAATASRRWLLAACVGWTPYLYWGLVEWRGDFSRVHWAWPIGSGLFSAYAILCAALTRYLPPEEVAAALAGEPPPEDAPAEPSTPAEPNS